MRHHRLKTGRTIPPASTGVVRAGVHALCVVMSTGTRSGTDTPAQNAGSRYPRLSLSASAVSDTLILLDGVTFPYEVGIDCKG